MKNKGLFKSRRWNECPKATVVRNEKTTKQEKKKNKEEFDKILKERGIKK